MSPRPSGGAEGADRPGADALVRTAIRGWRDSLINLSGTNRLLNFKSSRAGAVRVVRPTADEILAALTTGQQFRFRSIAEPEDASPELSDGDSRTELPVPPAEGERLPPPRADLLDTDKSEKDLAAALRNLARRSSQEYLDRGVWILYLAFGALTWREEDGTTYTSPLLLVPVQLTSAGPRQDPVLSAIEEDPALNPALGLKMAQFGVVLPGLADPEDLSLQPLLAGVRSAIRGRDGWRVTEDVTLSYFSFHKEAMYRDLLENEDQIAQHPAIAALATGGHGREIGDFLFDEISHDRIDEDAPPESTPLVLDADSSQRACVAAAVDGRSFVMDGPPGTGKSQTISNMIGALLHAGKTVLFVSEKAAALEVVRNRLTETGLGNYVLELHSHKATRREVATALGAALETVPVAPKPMSPIEVNIAGKRRRELNAYAEAMNALREPLGFTLHYVLGKIALLHQVPAAPATGRAPTDLTVEQLGEILATAAAIARAWRPAAQGRSYVWRGVTDRSSLDARLYRAASALEVLAGTARLNEDLADAFGLDRPSQADTLANILDLAAARPAQVPDAWLTLDDLEVVDATLTRLAHDLHAVAEIEERATAAAGVSWRTVPGRDSLPLPDVAAFAGLSPNPIALDPLDASTATDLAERFGADAERLTTRVGSLAGMTALLDLPPVETFQDAEDTLAVAALTSAAERPERHWLSPSGLQAATIAATELHRAWTQFGAAETAARAYYNEAVFSADVHGLAHRFTHVHKGLRKLRGEYRADKRAVAALARDGVQRDAAIANLRLAVEWVDAKKALAHVEATHAAALGFYYARNSTNFNLIQRALANATVAVRRSRTDDLGRLADVIAADAPPNPELTHLAAETRADLEGWRSTLAPEPALAARPELLTVPLTDGIAWLRAHLGPLHATAASAAAVSEAVGRPVTLGEARALAELRTAVDRAHATLGENAADYADICEGLFQGRETDVDAARAALDWARTTRRLQNRADAPLAVIQAKAMAVAVPSPGLRDAAVDWAEAQAAILAAFDDQRRGDLDAELDDYAEGPDLIAALQEDTAGQEEWFAYQQARQALTEHGLDVALDFCIAERVPPTQVPQVLERALLQEWADHILAGDPALQTVRAEDRAALIAEYRKLDKRLIGSAASSIITAVNSRRPRISIGQPAVIQREAAKKRKHMPVRTLIERTQQATLAIKPCFMMSPLAVSQYLTPDMHFDVVIFDEASQVRPSDAINCIYRGGALITAGDQKQLPPTSFFAAGTDDGDDEWSEEDEENSKDFESILDLCKGSGAFKSLTLRWHYRSRHEALIAFSNASFYGSHLVTFPGAEEEGPHVGVDLFPVPGVYRRGSSRDNPLEAATVVERVMHHFETRPHLTLGVVTFSEAQAACIEYAVEQARAERPHLERFFTDDRLDGFFVKNLESVQGDERDVVIFSIGYGPDETGKITMNFGPVNRPGGWRRLNVAVTRARYRNEIVTSIGAGDILESSKSEGVRHLRRYLDYADRGIPALGLDLTQDGGDAESPFEESVLTAIRSWGYDVTPQVGAAGYRIDIGVRHPDHLGVFALGVECDGSMYHSSRVARDRDRLREQVLRGLGWHLHRIWGTAWYRDRPGEEDRLRAAIEAAVAAPIHGLLGGSDVDDHIERGEVLTSAAVLPEAPEWAVPYEIADVDPLPRWIDPSAPGSRYDMRGGIEQIATIEGPVHLSVLFQRLRDAWNIGRIGPRIRENIEAAITHANVTRTGDFIDVPGRTVTLARTPTDDCARNIDQVADDELALAIRNFARAAGSVSHDELTTAIARLYGWNRRGADIAARLGSLLASLIATGDLSGDHDGLTATR